MSEMFEVVATGQATLHDDGEVVVEITDVIDGTIKVHARDLSEGDALLDAFGGTHKIKARQDFASGKIHTVRIDDFVDCWEPTDIVTILPDGNRGRQIDFEGSGSRQGFIETGFYSTLDEDRDINPHNYDQEV